jgi:3-methyl-2-oxobutanoate hydroxymethyltransferase
VLEDMLGLSPRVPKFVKRYGDLADGIADAVKTYAEEVRSRQFPGREHVYGMRGERVDAPGPVTKKPKITGN